MKLHLHEFKNTPLGKCISMLAVAVIYAVIMVSVIVIPYGIILTIITGTPP